MASTNSYREQRLYLDQNMSVYNIDHFSQVVIIFTITK